MTGFRPGPGEALLVASRGQGLWQWRREAADWEGALVASAEGLSALAVHPRLPVVYATAGAGAGRLLAWNLPRGEMLVNADTGGHEPGHLAIDPEGRVLIVANYASGNLALWRLDAGGGLAGGPRLVQLEGSGPDPDRQESAHPHQVLLREDGVAVVIDLGADLLREFRLDTGAGVLEPLRERALPAGSGPRHGVFLPGGRMAISAELGNAFLHGAGDDWGRVPATMLAREGHARFARNYPGDIALGAAGFVHMANRSLGTVATLDTGGKEPRFAGEVETGLDWPQHLLVHRDHLLVAGEDSGRVVAHELRGALPGAPEVLFDCEGACWLSLWRSRTDQKAD